VKAFQDADLLITPSEFARTKFIEFGVAPERIIHIDHGFPDEYYTPADAKEPHQGIRFGYIGTWIPSKGLHVLISAFNKLHDPRAELLIYGKDVPYFEINYYLDHIKSMARNERIRFMGPYDNKDVLKILSAIDVAIIPSIWYETFSLTVHEAFLAGVPVIASDLGAMKEYVEGRGLLFSVGDADDLARTIQRLLDKPELITNMRSTNVKTRLASENAADILDCYRELVEARKKRPISPDSAEAD
jgi:glycosyltransferase involved in cell wall biosynthesis